ncbi:MAG: FAD-dependent oxidoreductase [Candidatus Nanopelagicaceae bacterium]|jgi:NADPH-dependent 2,4-dienoyl-CoA reductase/sulfur reductase-like enzyme/rhodanese-related sulfurtransferase
MRVVIIGGVAGGMSAATRLRRLNESAEIIVLERSGHVSYANCGLPYYVGGVIAEEEKLYLQTPESLHKRFRLDVRVHNEVIEISSEKKVVISRDLISGTETEISFDKLILSPGATPVIPPIPGIERALSLRTVEDVLRIHDEVETKPKSAVVIGGGFIGVEMAENLIHKGIKTSLIEALPQVLGPLDPEMAEIVHKEMRKHGVDLHLANSVKEITDREVILSDGTRVEAEVIIAAIGVKPDIHLAKIAGVAIGEKGGIAVNAFNQTSNPDIYAIGDAAEKKDELSGDSTLIPLANLANRHGRITSDHIAGKKVREVGSIGTAIVKVFDLAVATTGWSAKRLSAANKTFKEIHTHPNSHATYYPGAVQFSMKLLFDPINGEILGAQGVGRDGVDKRIDVIATAMRGGITAPELADLELAYAPPFGSAKDAVNMLGYVAENIINSLTETAQWHEIDKYRNEGFSFVDVRSSGEFANGTIPGSINIPVDEMRERHTEIANMKVIVNCQVGQRGHVATMLLRSLGYDAKNLDGGYLTWINSPAASQN